MAQRLRYTGDAVLTLEEVSAQVQGVPADQESLVEEIIIPAVIAQAEGITGAAIRQAEYVEHWPASGRTDGRLDVGQAKRILGVRVQGADADLPESMYSLQVGQRVSSLTVSGIDSLPLQITYEAGLDMSAYPCVKQWLLMQAATLFAHREVLVTGTIVARLPESFLDTLLSDITVPPRF